MDQYMITGETADMVTTVRRMVAPLADFPQHWREGVRFTPALVAGIDVEWVVADGASTQCGFTIIKPRGKRMFRCQPVIDQQHAYLSQPAECRAPGPGRYRCDELPEAEAALREIANFISLTRPASSSGSRLFA